MSSSTRYNFAPLFDDYVVGDDFSATYYGAGQCYAYALIAADTYSHRYTMQGGAKVYASNWTTISGDEVDLRATFPVFGTGENQIDPVAFILSLPIGSQVRVAKSTNPNLMHSLLVVKATSLFLITMEANVGGDGKVHARALTYNYFETYYQCLARYDSHHFSSAGQNAGPIYHARVCTSAGCRGYIFEEHSFVQEELYKVCSVCGYTR